MNTFTPIDDRVIKVSGGKLVDTEFLEKEIKRICHYVQYVTLGLNDKKDLVAIIFPNKALFINPDYLLTPEEGCFCPRNLKELGKCLSGCMQTINLRLLPGHAKISSAVIINTELSIEDGTLTPALNPIPESIIRKYFDHLRNLYGEKVMVKEEAYNMKFN